MIVSNIKDYFEDVAHLDSSNYSKIKEVSKYL